MAVLRFIHCINPEVKYKSILTKAPYTHKKAAVDSSAAAFKHAQYAISVRASPLWLY
jgi:hypothetical protein